MLMRSFESQIRCLSSQTSEEDGNNPTRQICLHLLRKDHRQETFGRNLGLQVVPQDGCWRSIHCVVRSHPHTWMQNMILHELEHRLTLTNQNTRRGCHAINASTIEGNCGGLDGFVAFGLWLHWLECMGFDSQRRYGLRHRFSMMTQ